MYKKFNDYLNNGSETLRMYKQLIATFVILMLIYLANIWLGNFILSLEKSSMYQIANIIYLSIIKTGYNMLFFITILNVVYFGFKMLDDLDVSIHLFFGHVLNLATMLLIIYVRMLL